METSAKASINVEEAFTALARDIKSKMDKKTVCNSCCLANRRIYIWIYMEAMIFISGINCLFSRWSTEILCSFGLLLKLWNICNVQQI